MKFIESKAIQNDILNDAEKAAILKEVMNENPEAGHVEIVDGGVAVFSSYIEYCTWIDQV